MKWESMHVALWKESVQAAWAANTALSEQGRSSMDQDVSGHLYMLSTTLIKASFLVSHASAFYLSGCLLLILSADLNL